MNCSQDPNQSARAIVVAPTFNNGSTLVDVLHRVERIGLPVVVVNDGSTDNTGRILENWRVGRGGPPAFVVTHLKNRGKAEALSSGFARALEAGYTHAVTLDTDGQLDPDDIPALLVRAQAFPGSLVLGTRVGRIEGCPRSSLVGRATSALGVFLETGRIMPDTQCGLRIYPLADIARIHSPAGRFGWEAEAIVRWLWTGRSVIEVPVGCRYLPVAERVSHFRPWRDGLQGFLMHARLTLRRLLPVPVANRVERVDEGIPSTGGFNDWSRSIHPAAFLRFARGGAVERLIAAAALGIGAFFGSLPLGHAQIPAALYAGWRVHAHLIPLLLMTLLTGSTMGLDLGGRAGRAGSDAVNRLLNQMDSLTAPTVSLISLGESQRLGEGTTTQDQELPGQIPGWISRSTSWLARGLAGLIAGVTVGFFANWLTIGLSWSLMTLVGGRQSLEGHE